MVVASQDRRHRKPSVGKDPSLSAPLGQRVGGQGKKTDFHALDFSSGDVAPRKRPADSAGNGPSERFGYQGTKYAPCRHTLESGKARKSKAVQGKGNVRQGMGNARQGNARERNARESKARLGYGRQGKARQDKARK